jgi:hypothetical protein
MWASQVSFFNYFFDNVALGFFNASSVSLNFVQKFEFPETERASTGAGLPDFSLYMIPKPEKMYHMSTKCKKWS